MRDWAETEFIHDAVMEASDFLHFSKVVWYSEDSIEIELAKSFVSSYIDKYGIMVRDY